MRRVHADGAHIYIYMCTYIYIYIYIYICKEHMPREHACRSPCCVDQYVHPRICIYIYIYIAHLLITMLRRPVSPPPGGSRPAGGRTVTRQDERRR